LALKAASVDARFHADDEGAATMRTTIALDDELLEKAKSYSGINETAALIREALKRLIEREAARRLARLGGTMPELKPIPRRRTRRG
jgi:Arc/MetJ family transcription regulator